MLLVTFASVLVGVLFLLFLMPFVLAPPPLVGEQSTVMSMSVCLCVRV